MDKNEDVDLLLMKRQMSALWLLAKIAEEGENVRKKVLELWFERNSHDDEIISDQIFREMKNYAGICISEGMEADDLLDRLIDCLKDDWKYKPDSRHYTFLPRVENGEKIWFYRVLSDDGKKYNLISVYDTFSKNQDMNYRIGGGYRDLPWIMREDDEEPAQAAIELECKGRCGILHFLDETRWYDMIKESILQENRDGGSS